MTVMVSLCFLPECKQKQLVLLFYFYENSKRRLLKKKIYNFFFFFYFFAERLGNEGYKKKLWLLSCLCVDLGKATKDFTV